MLKKWFFILFLLIVFNPIYAQQTYFFREGTNRDFYDQGIVDVKNLGNSEFEHTYPPGGSETKWNDKIPCSANAYNGATSMKFKYKSSDSGNWKVSIHRKDWSSVDISSYDSIQFYIKVSESFPNQALPLIGILAEKEGDTQNLFSQLYPLADYNIALVENQWLHISFPLDMIFNDHQNNLLNFKKVKAIVFNQSEKNNTQRLFLIDDLSLIKTIENVPAVDNFTAKGYEHHVELNWEQPMEALTYQIYASLDDGKSYQLRGETDENYYLDFFQQTEGINKVLYRIYSSHNGKKSEPVALEASIRKFSDDELLQMVQEYTFRYFWEDAHSSGMILERTGKTHKTVASGATGMGLMAMIVAHERNFRDRKAIKNRVLKILNFLETCDRYHGAWSHWYNGDTQKTQPFSKKDNGGDLVETSFVAQGLIAVKNYFSGNDATSREIRNLSNKLWREIDWNWYRRKNENVLYWHWSPQYQWQMNLKVSGWNEALITYIMAAASPTYGIEKEIYSNGWAKNGRINNKRTYYGYEINLQPNWGGPLFWIHYSHLGINPKGLSDQYANYWKEYVNVAKIHHAYAIDNPLNFKNYSARCWGLTASDDPYGYSAHRPKTNDNGTVSPTAALASMPYVYESSMQALKYFYRERGEDLFGKYGFYDAFNDQLQWVKKSYLGIDQAPIIIMIENYRTGLLWKYVMKDKDILDGLEKLGFHYELVSNKDNEIEQNHFKIYPNPVNDFFTVENSTNCKYNLSIYNMKGQVLLHKKVTSGNIRTKINLSFIPKGVYFLKIDNQYRSEFKKIIKIN